MSEPIKLFDHPDAPDQLSLFGPGEDRMSPPVRSFAPDAQAIRARLNALLATARTACTMPWPERDARMWATVFPQMADWLPEEEANQLRFDFAEEIRRLKAA